MTLRTIAVPDPAAGADWRYTVPGRYLLDVTSATATLAGAAGLPTVMHDVSGNGNDGSYTYDPALTPLSAGFFAGALRAHWYENDSLDFSYATTPAGACDITDVFSFDCWVQGDAAVVAYFPFGAFGGPIAIGLEIHDDGVIVFQYSDGTFFQQRTSVAGAFPFDGNGHHVGCSYSGAAMVIYVNGAAVAGVTIGVGGTTPGLVTNPELGRMAPDPGLPNDTYIGQPAFYQSVLGAGAFAAHAAAGTSLAAYSAAVLASTPVTYYDLDDETAATGRQVALDIATSTGDVAQLCSGFPEVATPGPYLYTWLPNQRVSAQSAGGTVTTVAIPRLILPAGYTIGTRTLDLAPTDQWSDITLWWDDSAMLNAAGVDAYRYPPSLSLRILSGGDRP